MEGGESGAEKKEIRDGGRRKGGTLKSRMSSLNSVFPSLFPAEVSTNSISGSLRSSPLGEPFRNFLQKLTLGRDCVRGQ